MRRLQSPLVLIAVLLGLVTLQLGGNRPIAWVFAALGLAVIAANAALGVKPGAQATPLRLVLRNCHFALAGFALLGGIALVQLLSTTAFGASLATSPLVPLTFDPPATLGSLLTVLTLGLLFLLSALTCRTGDDARMLVALHFWATALIGVLSLFAFLLGGDLIFGFDAWAYQGSLTGPFVNRNSFATFLGMGLASGVALALGSVARLRRTYGRDRSDGYVVSAYLTSATTFS
ncbi:MAG: hypothetical protein KI785_13610, partial [Devosiaceae bacterium]|nr:hypothetical protein [Devosiaceae bacterium MH13]